MAAIFWKKFSITFLMTRYVVDNMCLRYGYLQARTLEADRGGKGGKEGKLQAWTLEAGG